MKYFNLLIAGLAMTACANAMIAETTPYHNEKGKWGYVNEAGSEVIPCKYDHAGYFVNGLAQVKKGTKTGMIDESGREIIPVKYDEITPHNESVYRVAAGGKLKDGVLMDEKYGFVNDQGAELLKPEYDEVGPFREGVAYVRKGSKYGYISDHAKVVVPCEYDAVGSFNATGHAWVCKGAKFEKNSTSRFTRGTYGIIDRSGKIIVPVKHKKIGYFSLYEYIPSDEALKKLSAKERMITTQSGTHFIYSLKSVTTTVLSVMPDDVVGFWASTRDDGSKNSVITLQGEELIMCGKYDVAWYPTEGLAPVKIKDKQYNYLNVATGEMLLKRNVFDAWGFQDGVAVITRADDFDDQLIDKTGNPVSESYAKIYPKKDGLYIVSNDKADEQYVLYGAIDATGREVVKSNHTYVLPPANGLLAAKNDDRCGYVDTNGNWKIQGLKSGLSFKDGFAEASTDRGWGVIDTTGRQVVKCRWKNTYSQNLTTHGLLFVTDEDDDNPAVMLLRVKDDKVLSPKYKWIRFFGSDFDEVALVGDDAEHVGILDTEGKLIIPAQFTPIEARVAYLRYTLAGRNTWTDFDTYCVKLETNPKRNQGRLTTTIDSSLWDY